MSGSSLQPSSERRPRFNNRGNRTYQDAGCPLPNTFIGGLSLPPGAREEPVPLHQVVGCQQTFAGICDEFDERPPLDDLVPLVETAKDPRPGPASKPTKRGRHACPPR